MRPSTSRSGLGLLCIAGAIGLGIVSFLLPYVWAIFLPETIPAGQESFYYSLHVVWIPLSGLLLLYATAALFVIGFLLAWRDRAHVDSRQRAVLGLASLAFALSVGAAGLLTFLGITAGLVYFTDIYVPIAIANVGLALAIGLTLYWLLLGEGVHQARLAGIIALVAGSASSVLEFLWRVTRTEGVGAIAATARFLSLTLWLALFLWGYEELRLRGVSRPSGLPA